VLDYIVGIVLILAPNIFQFSSYAAASWIARVIGVVLIVYSLFTNYEWGVVKVIQMPYHLVVDLVASIFLAISPFLFGFYKEPAKVWLPHLVVGIAVILVVIVTQTQPGTARRPSPA
jgi:hypothetical protein